MLRRRAESGRFCCCVVIVVGFFSVNAVAETPSWGNGIDVEAPHPDSKGRSGRWWWPGSARDGVKGNGGRVFGKWEREETVSEEESVPPPPVEIPYSFVCGAGRIRLNYILFPFDSVELSPVAKAEVDKYVEKLKKFPQDTLELVGHTDDVGPEAYNLQLGLRRAEAMKAYMVENGVARERIACSSKGEAEPAVPNDSPANRALNRRVGYVYTIGP